MSELFELEPSRVLKFFHQLTKIPRCSGNEKQVSDYLLDFAQKNGLEYIQEPCFNIVINKPAAKGYEESPSVILQAHMDMVCVKDDSLEFDFSREPIPVQVEGDTIRALGTTLGADNGIGVAMIMAVLENKDLQHPNITALVTVNEETGLEGVKALKSENIHGSILINLDGEEEGVFITSSAGGVTNTATFPVVYKESGANKQAFSVRLEGLLGGHSGVDINLNRGNAIQLMGRLLAGLKSSVSFELAGITGGEKMNAIPCHCEALLLVEEGENQRFQKTVAGYQNIFRAEYACSDPNITISVREVDCGTQVLTERSRDNLLSLMLLLPTGVETMSTVIPSLVESSSNLGVIEHRGNSFALISGIRSSVRSRKAQINEKIQHLCQLAGASMELTADYPEWEYANASPIRDLMFSVYKEINGVEPRIGAIHGGLECGFLQEKIGGLDMISIGPNILGAHSTNETVSIASVGRVFSFLCSVLARINKNLNTNCR